MREAPQENLQDLLQEAIRGKLQLNSNFNIKIENNIILLRDTVLNKSLRLAQTGLEDQDHSYDSSGKELFLSLSIITICKNLILFCNPMIF